MMIKSVLDVLLLHEKSPDACELKTPNQMGRCAFGDCDYNTKINTWKTWAETLFWAFILTYWALI